MSSTASNKSTSSVVPLLQVEPTFSPARGRGPSPVKAMSTFEPYPCTVWDDPEFTKQAAWNDYQNWRDNELSWAELDAMADAAVEWELRNV